MNHHQLGGSWTWELSQLPLKHFRGQAMSYLGLLLVICNNNWLQHLHRIVGRNPLELADDSVSDQLSNEKYDWTHQRDLAIWCHMCWYHSPRGTSWKEFSCPLPKNGWKKSSSRPLFCWVPEAFPFFGGVDHFRLWVNNSYVSYILLKLSYLSRWCSPNFRKPALKLPIWVHFFVLETYPWDAISTSQNW